MVNKSLTRALTGSRPGAAGAAEIILSRMNAGLRISDRAELERIRVARVEPPWAGPTGA